MMTSIQVVYVSLLSPPSEWRLCVHLIVYLFVCLSVCAKQKLNDCSSKVVKNTDFKFGVHVLTDSPGARRVECQLHCIWPM